MKNIRVTSILGAGVPLGFNLPAGVKSPTTENITDAVRQPYNDIFTGADINIVEDMYQHLMSTLPPEEDPWASKNEPYVHFELLFHVMEMYLSYEHAWGENCRNPNIFPIFGPFVKPTKIYDIAQLRQIMQQFIFRIIDIVKGYDDYFANDSGAEDWYRNFFLKAPWKWDLFNFNYDTTLENTFGENNYEDGFEIISGMDYSEFLPQKLFNNQNGLTTINHLHGCIRYYFERTTNREIYKYDHEDIFKYNDSNFVLGMMHGRSQSQGSNQTNEELYAGNIITGLRKTDKLNCIPYDYYHAHLCKSLLNSPRVLIAGYSFGDLYMNQQLERLSLIHGNDSRVVLIDYWKQKEIKEYGIERYMEYKAPHQMTRFLMKMCEVSYVPVLAKDLKFKDTTAPMYTSNGHVMLLVCGMKDAANYSQEIYDFLK